MCVCVCVCQAKRTLARSFSSCSSAESSALCSLRESVSAVLARSRQRAVSLLASAVAWWTQRTQHPKHTPRHYTLTKQVQATAFVLNNSHGAMCGVFSTMNTHTITGIAHTSRHARTHHVELRFVSTFDVNQTRVAGLAHASQRFRLVIQLLPQRLLGPCPLIHLCLACRKTNSRHGPCSSTYHVWAKVPTMARSTTVENLASTANQPSNNNEQINQPGVPARAAFSRTPAFDIVPDFITQCPAQHRARRKNPYVTAVAPPAAVCRRMHAHTFHGTRAASQPHLQCAEVVL